ncbi:hypothetical protein M758_2G027300 [Ceratodon purpureus]|uniref:Uncharacterized protein n=1 Tax=Ceratodon purpureus TaxID=3225 RepID=A0A8T0IPG9_CERPU|nr:hypothetical protein KC19_2G027700 [Ceratodon purpureus]KAG0625093.1 hypothetical protein M758_2G027300 [Ceratodon purpureus]
MRARERANLLVFLAHLLPLRTQYSPNLGERNVGIVSSHVGMLVLAEEHIRAEGPLGAPPSLLPPQPLGGPLDRGRLAGGRGFRRAPPPPSP